MSFLTGLLFEIALFFDRLRGQRDKEARDRAEDERAELRRELKEERDAR